MLGGLVVLPAAIGEAATYSARVRWRPSTSAGIAGYRVYKRKATGGYGTALDAGLPTPASDGTLSYVVRGLDSSTTYFFAVSAYRTDRRESVRSNELEVGADAGAEPCAAFEMVTPLGVRTFMLRQGGGPALVAHGTFAVPAGFDPSSTGVTVEIWGDGGALIYRAIVPGSEFRTSPLATTFRYVRSGRHPLPQADGLERLVLRIAGQTADVIALGTTPAIRESALAARVGWVIHAGTECARTLSLICSGPVGRTSCH